MVVGNELKREIMVDGNVVWLEVIANSISLFLKLFFVSLFLSFES